MNARQKIERLGKWRTVLAGWQLGTRPKGDPESDAVRDHREQSLMLRAEVSALTMLLIAKGVFTAEELTEQLGVEADAYSEMLERRFPGFIATEHGISIDVVEGGETMARMNFKP